MHSLTKRTSESAKSVLTSIKNIGQMENKKTKPAKKVPANAGLAIESNDQYAASYLKTGSTSGVMYQMKLLTWVTWRLMCQNDPKISNWRLATEVANARGFHDLVLKYTTNDTLKGDGSTSDQKYMYRFIQIKHKRSLKKNANINANYLTSQNKLHRLGSLFYLFESYINMVYSYEKITPDQIVDLTIFTNMTMSGFKFLVPVENDKLYSFEGKGIRYRIDINVLKKEPGVMIGLYGIMNKRIGFMKKNGIALDDNFIRGFLRKLVFMVHQPSEFELEEMIIAEMGKTFNTPQIFYDNLYRNMIKWFLIYEKKDGGGTAPYLTDDYVMKHLKETQDLLWKAKKEEILVDTVSTLADKLKSLSL